MRVAEINTKMKLGVVMLVLFMVVWCGEGSSESGCLELSRFEYEYQVLQKIIQSETIVKDLQSKMDSVSLQVNTQLEHFTEQIAALHEAKDQSETARQALQSKVDVMATNASQQLEEFKQQISTLHQNKDQLLAQVEILNNTLTGRHPHGSTGDDVLFKAQRTSDLTLSRDQILIFDKVLQNIGNAYNPSTGVFVAPCRGRYLFAVNVLAQPNKFVHTKVVKNTNTELGHFYTGQGASYSSGSETYVVDLDKGDTVAVKEWGTTGHVCRDGWSSFMGVILTVY